MARQKALLERFATLVKPGGRLIYGTCSVLREENEAVVEDFLAAPPGLLACARWRRSSARSWAPR